VKATARSSAVYAGQHRAVELGDRLRLAERLGSRRDRRPLTPVSIVPWNWATGFSSLSDSAAGSSCA
jgi:hypothetical protein